jgi:hypothetical protein
VLIAYNATPTGFRNWTSTPTQKSVPIRLLKGARYYIETLHKQGAGDNYLSVGWVLPTGEGEGPIPDSRLSPYAAPDPVQAGAQSFVTAMAKANTIASAAAAKELQVTATPNPSTSYFSIMTASSSDKFLMVTVTDVAGRIMEKKMNVPSNGTIRIGTGLPTGIYFVEVRQGGQTKKLKLVKL